MAAGVFLLAMLLFFLTESPKDPSRIAPKDFVLADGSDEYFETVYTVEQTFKQFEKTVDAAIKQAESINTAESRRDWKKEEEKGEEIANHIQKAPPKKQLALYYAAKSLTNPYLQIPDDVEGYEEAKAFVEPDRSAPEIEQLVEALTEKLTEIQETAETVKALDVPSEQSAAVNQWNAHSEEVSEQITTLMAAAPAASDDIAKVLEKIRAHVQLPSP